METTTTTTSDREVTALLVKSLKNPDNLFCFVGVVFNGTMQALVYTYTFVYMKEYNAPTMIFGLGFTVWYTRFPNEKRPNNLEGQKKL